MKNAFAGLLVGTTLLLSAGSVAAHDNIRVIGTITGYKANAVQVKTKEGAEAWIRFAEDTEITRDNAKVAATELKEGRYVVIDGWGDTFFDLDALKIRLVPPPK